MSVSSSLWVRRLTAVAMVTIVVAIAVPRRRWIIGRTWDRAQIPKPFSSIDYYFADPISPRSGESLERLAGRIEAALHQLEHQHDPSEARFLVKRVEAEKTERRRVA